MPVTCTRKLLPEFNYDYTSPLPTFSFSLTLSASLRAGLLYQRCTTSVTPNAEDLRQVEGRSTGSLAIVICMSAISLTDLIPARVTKGLKLIRVRRHACIEADS